MKKIISTMIAIIMIISLMSACAFALNNTRTVSGWNFNNDYYGWKQFDTGSDQLYVYYYPLVGTNGYKVRTAMKVHSMDVGYWAYVYTRTTAGHEVYASSSTNNNGECWTALKTAPSFEMPKKNVHYGSHDPDESETYRYEYY